MADLIIMIVLVIIILIVIAASTVGCRYFGIWTWVSTRILGNREEKAKLTTNEHHNGYMESSRVTLPLPLTIGQKVTSESEFALDNTGTFRHYDHVDDPKYFEMVDTAPDPVKDPLDSPKISPAISEAGSIASLDSIIDVPSSAYLQRATSCDSIDSDSSVFEYQPDSPIYGQLEFGIDYDKEISELVVSVMQAKDLQGSDPSSPIDSYVKILLLPDKDSSAQTKVQRRTNNPIYKERLFFNVDPGKLDSRIVHFLVYASDKYTNALIGEAEIKLCDFDLKSPISMWMNLQDINQKSEEFGDIMFSLSYLPTAERLTCVIVKARNLKWTNNKETGDPFVKVYLLQNGKKIRKKKTSVKRDEKSPIFNEAMIFSVSTSALQNVQLRVTVAQFQTEGRSPSIGHVIVGANTTGKALSHWNQMMTSLRKPIAMWHALKKQSP